LRIVRTFISKPPTAPPGIRIVSEVFALNVGLAALAIGSTMTLGDKLLFVTIGSTAVAFCTEFFTTTVAVFRKSEEQNVHVSVSEIEPNRDRSSGIPDGGPIVLLNRLLQRLDSLS
jgi:hypothetical protein